MTIRTTNLQNSNMQRLYEDVRSGTPLPSIADYQPLGEWGQLALRLLREGNIKTFMLQLQHEDWSTFQLLAVIVAGGDIIEFPPEVSTSIPEQEQNARTRLNAQGQAVFRTMSEDDVENLPDIQWQVRNILQAATVSLVFGESSVGKTFFALHMAQCIARYQQWYGHKTQGGAVLYIYAEGIRGLKLRSQAYRKKYNLPKTDNIQYIGFPIHLLEEREELLRTINTLQEERGVTYTHVVIDTLSNCSGGVNQNDQMEITRLLATAHEIVREHGSHVMVVHHTNRNGKFNGSEAFRNHVDTMIELRKDTEVGPIVMHCHKQRDGAERFKDILLELEVIDLGYDEDGVPITSCVMVLSQAQPASIELAERERKQMLAVLKQYISLSQAKWLEHSKLSRRTFELHLEYLKSQGLVTWSPEQPRRGQTVLYRPTSAANQLMMDGEDYE